MLSDILSNSRSLQIQLKNANQKKKDNNNINLSHGRFVLTEFKDNVLLVYEQLM